MTTTAPAARARSYRRSTTNRRRRMPLSERLPDLGQVRAACGRAGRAALPGAITVAALAAAAGSLFLGYRWLTGSPRFALAGAEVVGTRELTAADIETVIAPVRGENLFRLSLDEVEGHLRAEPWVADVSVRRRLPDTLVIEIAEHRAAAVVDLDGLYLADASGHVFKRADLKRGETDDLPVVTGIGRDQYRRRTGEAEERIRAALGAAAAYASVGARLSLGEVHSDLERGITLFTRRPVVALHLGRPVEPAELARRLALFDATWAALDPAERAALSSVHLDRDGTPVRVTVAFADPR